MFDKNFKAHVTIDNLNCNMLNGKSLATYIKEDVYSSDGVNSLYYHDGQGSYTNANLEATDNTYRYAGADADVHNYVCFKGDDCTDENNLYRIISVDSKTNQTKVIKATSLGNMKWDEKTGYIAKAGDTGLTAGTTYRNIWAIKQTDGSYYTSSLNDYLNGTYLTSLGNKANKIETTVWSVGGAPNNDINSKKGKAFMDVELNNGVTYSAKIGLMYVNEYGFAALPEVWRNEMFYYGASKGKDWLLIGYDWTISRASSLTGDNSRAFSVRYDGYIYDDSTTVNTFGVRPCFNLKHDVKITNADTPNVGSKSTQ